MTPTKAKNGNRTLERLRFDTMLKTNVDAIASMRWEKCEWENVEAKDVVRMRDPSGRLRVDSSFGGREYAAIRSWLVESQCKDGFVGSPHDFDEAGPEMLPPTSVILQAVADINDSLGNEAGSYFAKLLYIGDGVTEAVTWLDFPLWDDDIHEKPESVEGSVALLRKLMAEHLINVGAQLMPAGLTLDGTVLDDGDVTKP